MVQFQSILLILIAFAIPLSTSVVSVLALLLVLVWLVERDFKRKFREIFTNEVCVAILIYLGLYALGMVWTDDFGAGIGVLKRYWKLLLMPIFLNAVPVEKRQQVIWGFVAGLLIMVAGTYLAWFDLLHYGGVTPEHPTRKLYHVVYNPMLALGCYLVIHELIWGKNSSGWRIALAGIALVMSVNMFITEGRAGQVAFFVLLFLLLLQVFRKKIAWGVTLAVILIPFVFAVSYKLSPNFHERVYTAWKEVKNVQYALDTSIGHRLYFWATSWEVFTDHPLFGVGTGDYKVAYALKNLEQYPRLPPLIRNTENPHNQYILVLAQLGLLGFAAFLAIFILQVRQALSVDDQFQRIRLAFPLLFLTIMLTESYLIVNETGFLFSLFAAVLYKKGKEKQQKEDVPVLKKRWLILSFRSNIDGSACAQHIDDRLPFFLERGITPIMLTGTIGDKTDRWPHFRCVSLAPSGIRFELRHYLRKKFKKRWQFKLIETILLLPVFPLYLLEKIIINLESEWSWFISSSIRGYFLCRRFKPEIIYTTGGTASAHIAGEIISRLTGLPWIAETQDPLMHDEGWRRGKRVKAVYMWIEKRICRNADIFLFLAPSARENMANRSLMPGCGKVIYPGANPGMFKQGLYEKRQVCHFAHFGTLDGTRNLIVFLTALNNLIKQQTVDTAQVNVDVYGALDGGSARVIKEFGLEDMVTDHGKIPRKQALLAMQKTECLLLIQNTIFFSSETIPSKVYEYMLSGRPIIGLVYRNPDLEAMLRKSGNFPVPADDVEAVAGAIKKIVAMHTEDALVDWQPYTQWTVAKAVDELIRLGEEAARRIN